MWYKNTWTDNIDKKTMNFFEKCNKNEEIKLNKDYSLFVETKELNDNNEIQTIISNVNLIKDSLTANLYNYKRDKIDGNDLGTHVFLPTMKEIISQSKGSLKKFNFPNTVNILFAENKLDQQFESDKKNFTKRFVSLDPDNKAGFKEWYYNGEKNINISFAKDNIVNDLTKAEKYLNTLNSAESNELKNGITTYLFKYKPNGEYHNLKVLLKYNLINEVCKIDSPQLKSQNFDFTSAGIEDEANELKNNSAKLKTFKENVLNSLETNNQDLLKIKEAFINDCVKLEKDRTSQKSFGKLSKEELNNLSTKELEEKMINSLNDIQFDVAKERQEFFKFISGFKSINYSYRNCLILQAQAKALGYAPVFASMKEWNKQKTSIQKGSSGLYLCTPQTLNFYFEKNEDGTQTRLPMTWDKDEIKVREQAVKDGKMTKTTRLQFKFIPSIFSITQTNMKEEDKVKYLQQYNAHNTSEENKAVLKKELELCEKLGFKVEKHNGQSAIGWVAYNDKVISLDENMPVDAQISVLTHELGHYLFHRFPEVNPNVAKLNKDKKYNKDYHLSHNDREIQAQLFSHIVLEGLGVDSESEYSLRYINGYLFKGERNEDLSLNEVSKSALNAHLQIVHKEALEFTKVMEAEEITDMDIKNLQDFMPDRYTWDRSSQRASVVLNSTIIAKEQEELAKIEEAKKLQDERKQQEKTQQKHTTRVMQQSM